MTIDLRSDTVTVPDEEMRKVISEAEVGDDVYGEDPSVNQLQNYIAELTGKEASIFLPSGTMANQIGIKVNTSPGDEVICEADAHIFYYETAGPSLISQVQLNCIPSQTGMPAISDIEKAIRPDIYYFPRTKLICLENTHNRHGGTIIDIDYIRDVKKLADKHNLSMHLDGARLWNASAATGISIKEYSGLFDTINLCLSKGLGAPAGSMLCGSKEKIDNALKWRKILGGGMRQIGLIAKAGLHAVENNFPKLKQDGENAKYFAERINQSEYIECDIDTVHTNMVAFKCVKGLDADALVENLKKENVLMMALGNNMIRTVFHIQISEDMTHKAADIVLETAERSI